MKKYYLDNEYNDCACIDPRVYSTRVPAEKPFESKPRKHSKCTPVGDTHQEKHKKHRKHVEKEHRPVRQATSPMKVLYQPVYYPNIPSDHEWKKIRRDSNDCSIDCVMYQSPLPATCAIPNPKGVYTSPCRMPYPSTSTDDTFSYKRRVLNGQYPCPCMPVPMEYQQDCLRPIPLFRTSDCKESEYLVNEPKDSRSSAGKRAWCYIKRKTKRMMDTKQQRKEARKRKRQKRRQNELHKYYSPPYVYQCPVQVAPYYTCQEHSHNNDKTTHTHVSKQTEAIPESDAAESETVDETTTQETTTALTPEPQVRRHSSPPPVDNGQDDACCCNCDLELCPCQCCHGELGCEARNTQTSCQNIRENFTQTDFPKRCCRCCRCCAKKARGVPCTKQTDTSSQSPGNNPKSPPESSPPTNRRKGCTKCPVMNNPYYVNQSPTNTRRDQKTNESKDKKSKKPPAKTQMVRTNSAQCMPELEHKATCCSCDQNISSTRMNHIFQHMYGQNYDTHPNLVHAPSTSYAYEPAFSSRWTTADMNAITCAKLKNIFAGDVFSSPLSGRNYNLSVHDIKSVPRIIETKIPKPLDIDTQQGTRIPIHNAEHNKLMTAICEAILTNSDTVDIDKLPIGTSDFLVKDDLCSEQNLMTQEESILEKYREKIHQLDNRISKLATCATDPIKSCNLKKDKQEKTTKIKHSSLPNNLPKLPLFPDNNSGPSTSKNGATSSSEIEITEKKPLDNIAIHVEKCISNRLHIDNLLKQLQNLYDRNKELGDLHKSFPNDKEAVTMPNLNTEITEKSNFGRFDYCLTETSDPHKNQSDIQDSGDKHRRQPNTSNPTGSIQIDLKHHLTNLDFSSIKFKKFEDAMGTASEYFHQKTVTQKNFILNNLPAFSSNISNAYGVKVLLGTRSENVKDVPYRHSRVRTPDLMSSRNKVQPVGTAVKIKLPLKPICDDVEDTLHKYMENMEVKELNSPEYETSLGRQQLSSFIDTSYVAEESF